jgi:large subunit ribosomal protein L18
MKANIQKYKNQIRAQRRGRVRAKVVGTPSRPRLTVARSLEHMYAQIIDDQAGKTLVSAHDNELGDAKLTKTEQATKVGELIAQKATKAGITAVVFDRTGLAYHGRIKAIADGARKGGLQF